MNIFRNSVLTQGPKLLICAALATLITGTCATIIFSADGPSPRALTAAAAAAPTPAAYRVSLIASAR
jgi:hypothetical protein